MNFEIFSGSQLIGSGIQEAQSWKSQSDKIAVLDPLHLDSQIHIIPLLNKTEDIKGLVNMLYSNLPFPDAIKKFNFYESVACMRDVGIFLGSIKRHGVEPVSVIPELDYVLDELQYKTELPPRDTLLHYTIWNPSGSRIRTYTGLNDEVSLIESVQMSMYPLIRAIYDLIALHSVSPEDERYSELCRSAEEGLAGMIAGIAHARCLVSPDIFANTLRFYYEPIHFYKEDYIGPGAVEMPLFVFDHLLWGAESRDDKYIQFKTTYLPYNLPVIREIYEKFNNKPSLLTKIIFSLCDDERFNINKINAAKSLLSLCNRLKGFRMPHNKLAEETYAYKREHNREYGSGGYNTDILNYILSLTLCNISTLEYAIKGYMYKHNRFGK